MSREILGEGPILAPEIMVVIDSDVSRARNTAREPMAGYLQWTYYSNNLLRRGFTESDMT